MQRDMTVVGVYLPVDFIGFDIDSDIGGVL
jgi:hypothetical protein